MKNNKNAHKLQVLILCKTNQRTNLIQQGLNGVGSFGLIRNIIVPDEIELKLPEFRALNLVLITPEYNEKQIKSFIETVKKYDIAKETAVIMLMDFEDSNKFEALQQAGVDDFIIPPYTLDRFNSIAILANKIIRKRSYSRRREAMTNKLETFMNQLNLVALNKHTNSQELLMNSDLLLKLGKALGPIPHDEVEMYLEVLIEVLTDPQRQCKRIGYNGASNRIRKRFEKLLEEELASIQLKGH